MIPRRGLSKLAAALVGLFAIITGLGAGGVAPSAAYAASTAATAVIANAQPRYMSAGGYRFTMAPEAKTTSISTTQYRFGRITIASPHWAASNIRFAFLDYYSVVGQVTSCGAPYVVDAASVWFNGTEYPVSFHGVYSGFTVNDLAIELTDPLPGLTLPPDSTAYLSVAVHVINVGDTFCYGGWIALKEQGESESASASSLASLVHQASPSLVDATGLQLPPVGGMFATGYVSSAANGPVTLDLCDSIADGTGFMRFQAGQRAAMSGLKVAMDDSASGRVTAVNTCSVGNGFNSYYLTGYLGDQLFQLVQKLGNVPWNVYNDELAVNSVGLNYSGMTTQIGLLKSYMFGRFGKMPWVQYTAVTEVTDTTTYGAVESSQAYYSANFGPESGSPARRTWNNAAIAGSLGDAYIDWSTNVTEGSDLAKWISANYSTTLNTTISGSPTSAVLNGACPSTGMNLVFDTGGTPDAGSGKYQVATAVYNGGANTCTVTAGSDQNHGNLTYSGTHASGVTVQGSWVIPGVPLVHPTMALHLNQAAAVEAQKPKYFVLPYN